MVDVSKLRKTAVLHAKLEPHNTLGQTVSIWNFNSKRCITILNDLFEPWPRLLEVLRNALKDRLPGTVVLLPDCFATTFSLN